MAVAVAVDEAEEPGLDACPDCAGDGWVLVEAESWGCCGNALPSGECCAAKYGDANLLPEPVQTQVACPTCEGRGEVESR